MPNFVSEDDENDGDRDGSDDEDDNEDGGDDDVSDGGDDGAVAARFVAAKETKHWEQTRCQVRQRATIWPKVWHTPGVFVLLMNSTMLLFVASGKKRMR
jgi:hypothetical protein